MKRFRLIFCLLVAVATCFGAANVFDMPSRSLRHMQLLAIMDAAHAQHEYAAMEDSSREGVELGTADELWSYNLACALALRGKPQEALAALDRAIDSGFLDTEHVVLDPDLASLRDSEGFKQRLARMKARREKSVPPSNTIVALPPDNTQTVMQNSSNTLWSFQMGLFQVFVGAYTNRPSADYKGPEAQTIRQWQQERTSAGNQGLLYANRDNNTMPLDITRFPGLLRLGYSQEMIDRELNIGLPNSLFVVENSNMLLPVIGHSSMGYMNSPYWRSQPRAVCGDPRQTALQSALLLGNQLFFYPAYSDYDPGTGDLFPANTPTCFAVAGANSAEQPFVEAAFAALAALRPETRAELSRTGLLMPTLQMLFRASQRTLKNREDYLTGIAHPPVFQAANLDTAKLVQMAHALTTNDLPPIVVLNVRSETQMIPDRDFFDILRSEQLFDSPLAVARIFRGAARTRTLEIRTQCRRTDAKLHWVVLQGDPAKVTFTPCATNSSLMKLTVAYHNPFPTPIGNGKRIMTARVDIGIIAETATGFSVPSFVSFCFLGNEQRTYADDGRIVSIDYTRRQTVYTDPLMSYARNWKDSYLYDAKNNMTGWMRRRGLEEERFTAYGHRVVATDSLGRATRAHVVRYMPRRVSEGETAQSLPDLAQMDDNIEISYRYASDSDFVGVPDLSTIKQGIQPPAADL